MDGPYSSQGQNQSQNYLLDTNISAGEPLDCDSIAEEARVSIALRSTGADNDPVNEEPISPIQTIFFSPISHHEDSVNSSHNRASNDINSFSTCHAYSDVIWLPYTLRPWFLWPLTALSLALGALVTLLWWKSQHNSGLTAEESAIVGWRFIPTLIAVLYTQLTAMLIEDVKRTEPFTRLAEAGRKGKGAAAEWTLLSAPKTWWSTLMEGFSPKKNGGRRSWVLICSTLVNVLAFLIISPFSSALLTVNDVDVQESKQVERFIPRRDEVIPVPLDREAVFRTTAALQQNVSTSPWVSDDYTMLPFWPLGVVDPSWDYQAVPVTQEWTAETIVLHDDFRCESLEMGRKSLWIDDKINGPDASWAISFQSSGGCHYNLGQKSPMKIEQAFSSWSKMDKFTIQGEEQDYQLINHTGSCFGEEFIIVSTAWISQEVPFNRNFLPNITAAAYTCASNITMASLPVKAEFSASSLHIHLNETEFRARRKPISEPFFNETQLKNAFTAPEWFSYMTSRSYLDTGHISGVSSILGTMYAMNITEMLSDTRLPETAAKIRRRIFGELVRSSLTQLNTSKIISFEGTRSITQRRILVVKEALIVVSTLLFLSFFLLGIICIRSRIPLRELNLSHDPGTVLGTASTVASSQDTLHPLRTISYTSPNSHQWNIQKREYYTTLSLLHEFKDSDSDNYLGPKHQGISSDSGSIRPPTVLRLWILALLSLSLISLTATLVALASVANNTGFHQAAFTDQVSISIGKHLMSFVPFSITPTLVAIGFGLWWNMLDTRLRFLQPFISMSKGATHFSHGVNICYQSSYWCWAACKAARNKDFILALVTFGTFLTQIFIVSMSTLFERQPSTDLHSIMLNRSLELRQIPFVDQIELSYSGYLDNETDQGRSVVDTLIANQSANWMYSGMIHATMNNTEPAWSSSGWNFVPTNLSDIPSLIPNLTGADSNNTKHLTAFVTLETTALRARAICRPIEELRNQSSWLESIDVTSKDSIVEAKYLPNKQKKLYQITPIIFDGTTSRTSAGPLPDWFTCCSNTTAQSEHEPMLVALGYWSSDAVARSSYRTANGPSNFTVKWIHGEAIFVPMKMTEGTIQPLNYLSEPTLFFTDVPAIQALHCQPAIESADAEVIVDQSNGNIQSYKILSEPRSVDQAWSDPYVLHNTTGNWNPDPFHDPSMWDGDDFLFDGDPFEFINLNRTTSFGYIFLDTLLHAAEASQHGAGKFATTTTVTGETLGNHTEFENPDELAFNIRQNQSGLNLDFMSYASYVQAGRDPEALLDQQVLLNQTQRTFSLFFQHFVSDSIFQNLHSPAYQPIGLNLGYLGEPMAGGPYPTEEDVRNVSTTYPSLNTSRTTTAKVSQRTEVLRMNPVATWLSISILIWLTITTLILTMLQRRYLGSMVRNVECIADVLVLIAGSDKLLRLVRERGIEQLRKDKNVYTKLDWFWGEDGRLRWGIEVVEKEEVEKKGRR